MRDSLRKTWLAGLWLVLALAVPFAAPLAAQAPIEGWDTEFTETEALVTQWDPSEGEMAALEDTWAGEIDIPGDANWTWFVQLTASASQVLVAPPIDPDIPYYQGIDYNGYVQNGALMMTFTEPGVYAVTIYYHDPAAPTRTYMVIAGAKKKGKQCGNRVFRIRRFVPPARDLYVVNSTTPDGYLDCSRAAVPAAQNVANWNALKTAIDNRHAALNRAITVFAISHGDISEQSVAPAFTLFNNNPNVQTMTAAPPVGVKGKVSRYDAFSCCTGANINNPPNGGPHLLDALANGLSVMGMRARASGYDQVTFCRPGRWRRGPSLFTVVGANLVVR